MPTTMSATSASRRLIVPMPQPTSSTRRPTCGLKSWKRCCGVPLGLAHRFQVVGGVLLGGLRQSAIGIVHTPSRFACTVPYGERPRPMRNLVERVAQFVRRRPVLASVADLLRHHRGAGPARPRAPVHDDRARRRRPAAHGRAAALERLGAAADARLVAVPDLSSHAGRAGVFRAPARVERGGDAGRVGRCAIRSRRPTWSRCSRIRCAASRCCCSSAG